MPKKEFNYVIGHYWEDNGSIAAYMMFNNEVFYGTVNQAKKDLKYVKRQDPDQEWKIFIVKELEKE